MGGTAVVTQVWKGWGIQGLVLLSFTLQVALQILAEFRRRVNSGMLRFLGWSAYMLADGIAIYVLGHLSAVNSRSPGEHELMAFWAPFLLLHLGGQDNITAYTIEDNRLWLRHLQTMAVQMAAAAYVIYQSSIPGSRSTILMFVVSVIKYGERVWALRCAASAQSSSNNYRSIQVEQYRASLDSSVATNITGVLDTEGLLLMAHSLLYVPKDWLFDRVSSEGTLTTLTPEEHYKVVEMQLSLMHDVFYTKTEVMHTWYGLCIRMISLPATAIVLLLFHSLGDHRMESYTRLDVAVTYVLLVGAVFLEITSVLRITFSSWTCWLLAKRYRCARGWHFLARVIVNLRRLVHVASWRSCWSRSLGQHNLLRLCTRSKTSRCSKIARWMGVENWWNTRTYSWSVPVSPFIEQLLVMNGPQQMIESEDESWSPDQTMDAQAEAALKKWGLYEDLGWSVEESILVWHVATDIYLCQYKEDQQKVTARCQDDDEQAKRRRADLAKAVEVLSNYMLFILAARPYMLPPPADRNAYVQMCYALLNSEKTLKGWKGLPALEYSSADHLASSLRRLGDTLNTAPTSTSVGFGTATPISGRSDSEMLIRGARIGAILIGEDQSSVGSSTGDKLEFVAQVWVQMLFYVGCRCSAYSHAKQLSNGSELITVASLLMKRT